MSRIHRWLRAVRDAAWARRDTAAATAATVVAAVLTVNALRAVEGVAPWLRLAATVLVALVVYGRVEGRVG